MPEKRTDADYEIDAVSKSDVVIEVLVEDGPIKEKKIVAKTGLSKDFVMRVLRTKRLRGYAVQNATTKEWSIGPRMIRVATDIRG